MRIFSSSARDALTKDTVQLIASMVFEVILYGGCRAGATCQNIVVNEESEESELVNIQSLCTVVFH